MNTPAATDTFNPSCQPGLRPDRSRQGSLDWRTIPGHSRYMVSANGRIWDYEKCRLMPISENPHRYQRVRLTSAQGGQGVHRYVYSAFNGPLGRNLQVMHLDGNPRNNTADNLSLGTASENRQMMHLHGTVKTKLCEADILEIRSMRPNYSWREIAEHFDVSLNCVRQIVTGVTWTHV